MTSHRKFCPGPDLEQFSFFFSRFGSRMPMFFSKSVTVSYKIRKSSEEKYNRKRKEERKKIF